MGNTTRILGGVAVAILASFASGYSLGRWSVPPARSVKLSDSAAESDLWRRAFLSEPLFDFNDREAFQVLDAVLTDWFTRPEHREKALSLLVDPMLGPFDGSRPPLIQVIVDTRSVPVLYRPRIPDVPAIVASTRDRTPIVAGELVIWINRFAVMPDGSLNVELVETNHGYSCLNAAYTVKRAAEGWSVACTGED